MNRLLLLFFALTSAVTASAQTPLELEISYDAAGNRIVDGSRTVVQSSHFDPWGNRMSASDWYLFFFTWFQNIKWK